MISVISMWLTSWIMLKKKAFLDEAIIVVRNSLNSNLNCASWIYESGGSRVKSDILLLVAPSSHNFRPKNMKQCVNTLHLSLFNDIIICIWLIYSLFINECVSRESQVISTDGVRTHGYVNLSGKEKV